MLERDQEDGFHPLHGGVQRGQVGKGPDGDLHASLRKFRGALPAAQQQAHRPPGSCELAGDFATGRAVGASDEDHRRFSFGSGRMTLLKPMGQRLSSLPLRVRHVREEPRRSAALSDAGLCSAAARSPAVGGR